MVDGFNRAGLFTNIIVRDIHSLIIIQYLPNVNVSTTELNNGSLAMSLCIMIVISMNNDLRLKGVTNYRRCENIK